MEPKVNCSVHKVKPLDPIPIQLNPRYIIFFKDVFQMFPSFYVSIYIDLHMCVYEIKISWVVWTGGLLLLWWLILCPE
jgi:hypothetical protein